MFSDGTFQYQLSNPVEYAFKGNMHSASYLLFKEPLGSLAVKYAQMRQIFMRAVPGMQKKAQELSSETRGNDAPAVKDDAEQDDSAAMFDLLSMTDGFDSEKFITAFQVMACSGNDATACVLVNGDTKMTPVLWEKLTYADMSGAAVAFVNFTQKSSETRKKSSASATASLL